MVVVVGEERGVSESVRLVSDPAGQRQDPEKSVVVSRTATYFAANLSKL